MQRILVILGVIVAIGIAAPGRADACGGGKGLPLSDGAVGAILLVGGTYVGVTVGMGVKDMTSDNHSVGYGIAETAIHAPIATLYSLAMIADFHRSQEYGYEVNKGLILMTALHGALAAHGIYTIAKDRPARRKDSQPLPAPYHPPGTFQVGRVTAAITPTATARGGGLGLAGSF
jgi:hypothetical protein